MPFIRTYNANHPSLDSLANGQSAVYDDLHDIASNHHHSAGIEKDETGEDVNTGGLSYFINGKYHPIGQSGIDQLTNDPQHLFEVAGSPAAERDGLLANEKESAKGGAPDVVDHSAEILMGNGFHLSHASSLSKNIGFGIFGSQDTAGIDSNKARVELQPMPTKSDESPIHAEDMNPSIPNLGEVDDDEYPPIFTSDEDSSNDEGSGGDGLRSLD